MNLPVTYSPNFMRANTFNTTQPKFSGLFDRFRRNDDKTLADTAETGNVEIDQAEDIQDVFAPVERTVYHHDLGIFDQSVLEIVYEDGTVQLMRVPKNKAEWAKKEKAANPNIKTIREVETHIRPVPQVLEESREPFSQLVTVNGLSLKTRFDFETGRFYIETPEQKSEASVQVLYPESAPHVIAIDGEEYRVVVNKSSGDFLMTNQSQYMEMPEDQIQEIAGNRNQFIVDGKPAVLMRDHPVLYSAEGKGNKVYPFNSSNEVTINDKIYLFDRNGDTGQPQIKNGAGDVIAEGPFRSGNYYPEFSLNGNTFKFRTTVSTNWPALLNQESGQNLDFDVVEYEGNFYPLTDGEDGQRSFIDEDTRYNATIHDIHDHGYTLYTDSPANASDENPVYAFKQNEKGSYDIHLVNQNAESVDVTPLPDRKSMPARVEIDGNKFRFDPSADFFKGVKTPLFYKFTDGKLTLNRGKQNEVTLEVQESPSQLALNFDNGETVVKQKYGQRQVALDESLGSILASGIGSLEGLSFEYPESGILHEGQAVESTQSGIYCYDIYPLLFNTKADQIRQTGLPSRQTGDIQEDAKDFKQSLQIRNLLKQSLPEFVKEKWLTLEASAYKDYINTVFLPRAEKQMGETGTLAEADEKWLQGFAKKASDSSEQLFDVLAGLLEKLNESLMAFFTVSIQEAGQVPPDIQAMMDKIVEMTPEQEEPLKVLVDQALSKRTGKPEALDVRNVAPGMP